MDCEDHSPVHLATCSTKNTEDRVLTRQTSTIFPPQISTILPHLDPNVPIPSIEPSSPSVFELPDTSNPEDLASFSADKNLVNTFEGVNISPANNSSQLFQVNQLKESSPFTFRNLHNATPEPRAGIDQATTQHLFSSAASGPSSDLEYDRNTGNPGAKQPFLNQASPNIIALQATKDQASSALVQPPVSNRPSRPAMYDTKDETPPEDEPYFNKDFQRALQAGKSIAQQIGSVLGTCELARNPESQVFSMIQTANNLSQFDAPSVCKIGVVGDSGVGKSSLINSLLDEIDLARTAGFGNVSHGVTTLIPPPPSVKL